MDLKNTKVKDLGKVTMENMKEVGMDMLDKTKEEVEELKEKLEKDQKHKKTK